MMSAGNNQHKDGPTGEPPLALVDAFTKQIDVESEQISKIVIDEENNAAVMVQQRLQQVTEVLQRLQSHLQCTICLDLLSDPVTTKCGHSFCLACMQRVLSGLRGASPCPLCLAPVTKRSLTSRPRMTQIVAAVRAIINSIKKDCGLMATPSKYRPRARLHNPAVEDNSDQEEMDEPRRGTRKRIVAPDAYLDMIPLQPDPASTHLAAEQNRKKSGGGRAKKRGSLGGGTKKNFSAPDLPSLVNKEACGVFYTDGPSTSFGKLSQSRLAMTTSTTSLSDHELVFPKPAGFVLSRPPPAGVSRGRGRGRATGRGRGRPASTRAAATTDDELLSVSQALVQQHHATSGLKSCAVQLAIYDKESKLVTQQKPKEKVAQWLDESSDLGFKIGISQNLHDVSLSEENMNTNEKAESDAAIEYASPTSANEGRFDKTRQNKVSNENKPLMCISANEHPQGSQSSTVVFDLASVPAHLQVLPMDLGSKDSNNLSTTLFDDNIQEMELPDIELITVGQGATISPTARPATSTYSPTTSSTPVRGQAGAVAAACNVSAITGSQDTIPDSCPVVTKDAFDVLVDTAKAVGVQQYELKSSGSGNDDDQDDVYFFRTPADGLGDEETATAHAATNQTSICKKRTLEEMETPLLYNKKSKLAVHCESTPNTKKRTFSNGSNSETKKRSGKLSNNKSLEKPESHCVEASLLPSCEAMPPPLAPVESKVGAATRRLRPSKTATKSAAHAGAGVLAGSEVSSDRPRNTRYASQLKKHLCEPPKLVATSIGIRDTKSPGWSHVIGAKKDLKTRHVGLNITGGECKLEITKLDCASVTGEKNCSLAPAHPSSSTNQVLSSGESSLEIDDFTQKFDVEHLDCLPGNLQQLQKLQKIVKNLNNDQTSKANEDELNGSDSGDSNNSANSEDHGATAVQTSAKLCCSKNGFMGLSSKGEFRVVSNQLLTSVPETQTSVLSPVSSCLASDAKEPHAHEGEQQPVTITVSVPSVDVCAVADTSLASKHGSPFELLETAVKSKSGNFQEQTTKGDDTGATEAGHCHHVQAHRGTVREGNHLIDQETDQNKDIVEFTAPVRRTVGSGKLRRETRSLRNTSSSSSTCSGKSKLHRAKSSSSSGGDGVVAVQITDETESGNVAQTNSESSLHSTEILPIQITNDSVANVISSQKALDNKGVAKSATIITGDSVANVISSQKALDNKGVAKSATIIAASAHHIASTASRGRSQTTCMSQPSTATVYCDTDATKYTSLATDTSPNELNSSTKSVSSNNSSTQHQSYRKQLSNHPRSVVVSDEDCEGLNFDEQTITPTVYKNKLMQVNLSVPVSHVAVQCEPRVPAVRSVAVQCDRRWDLALDAGLQTEVDTSSVGVQAQLAPHHLHVHGVIPYAATGPNCSDRCVGGGTSSLLQAAGLKGESLHAVPCSLYQAIVGMLHLAQPNPMCCHHSHEDGAHVKEAGNNLGHEDGVHVKEAGNNLGHEDGAHVKEAGNNLGHGETLALAIPFKPSQLAQVKPSPVEEIRPKQLSIVDKGNSNIASNNGEMVASATSTDTSVSMPADCLLVSGGPTRRSFRKKLHHTTGTNAALPPSGSTRKLDLSRDNDKPVLKNCSVRLISPKKGELEALASSSFGTFPSTLLVHHSKDINQLQEAPLEPKLFQRDDQMKSSNECSSEIPYLLEPSILRYTKLAKNQNEESNQNSVCHKRPNWCSSHLLGSSLEGNSKDAEGLAKTEGPPRLTRQNSGTRRTHVLTVPCSPRRKKAAMEADEGTRRTHVPTVPCSPRRKKAAMEADEGTRRTHVPTVPCSPRRKKAAMDEAIEDVASSGTDDCLAVTASNGEKENRLKGVQRGSGRLRRRPLQLQRFESANTDLPTEEHQDKAKPARADTGLQGSKQLFSSDDSASLTANTKRSIVKSRTNLFESISSCGKNAGVTAGKRFKRIRPFDNSDSSSEDEVQEKKKPNTKQALTSFTIGSCANPDDSAHLIKSQNDCTYQKNSEELRLDQFDDGLFEYFGLNKDETTNNSSVSTIKRDKLDLEKKLSSSTEKVVDLHTSFDELPEIGNAKDVAYDGITKDDKGVDCEDDEIPGTSEVLKNVALDIACIRKMRENTVKNIKTEKCSTVSLDEDELSQETVVLSSTQSSILGNNKYNLSKVDKETSLSSTSNRTTFTTQTRELFNRCDRSLRKVEQRLHSSQDTGDCSSSLTTGDRPESDATVQRSPRAGPTTGTRGSSDSEDREHLPRPDDSEDREHLPRPDDSDDREHLPRPDVLKGNNVQINSVSYLEPICGEEDNSLSHLSMMSTQSEVVSTQYRNTVQTEVNSLQAKMAALQRELLSCKPSTAEEEGGQEATQTDKEGRPYDAGDIASPDKEVSNVEGKENIRPTVATSLDEESDMFCSQQSTAAEVAALRPKAVKDRPQGDNTDPLPRPPLVLVCTGLSVAESALVLKLARTLGGAGTEVLRCWRTTVTHVIVSCGEDNITDRTLKYLYGIASGKWVLGIAWVKGSLQAGRLLSEEQFEALDSTGMPGPLRGRLHHGNLLKGATLCCLPPFTDVSYEQIEDLVRLCGGTLVSAPDQFVSSRRRPGDSSRLQLIVIQADEEGTGDSKRRAQELGALHGRMVVARDWLIECVAMYARIGLLPYILSATDDSLRSASGVSQSLMQETQDF